MGAKTEIAWTDATWNPVRGCSRVSPGCQRCYAESVAARFSGPGLPYEGLAKMTADGPRWTGKVRLVPEHLADPLRWKRPRRVFVNSMSDLFHESLSDEDIVKVFEIMHRAEKHTFQVLTKRAQRMRRFVDRLVAYPLPNVWLGVSVENQEQADKRIPDLLQTPAAVRFLSCEPLLGPVDLSAFMGGEYVGLPGDVVHDHYNFGIEWVIAGGESGPGARPCDLGWIRSLKDQCASAQVACFVKQLGSRPIDSSHPGTQDLHRDWDERLRDPKGGDMSEWPEDLRLREFPVASLAT